MADRSRGRAVKPARCGTILAAGMLFVVGVTGCGPAVSVSSESPIPTRTANAAGPSASTGTESSNPSISPANGTATAVSAGVTHTCALTSAGGVKCWGQNDVGELGSGQGTGALTYMRTPIDLVGLTSGVSAIAAGDSYSCALTTDGAVKCWGSNHFGELGNGSSINSEVPVDVVGLSSGVQAITAGFGHACALMSAGGVKCWGSNTAGGLGNGTTTNSNTPVDVVGLTNAAVISAGFQHTCAVTSRGGVKCWGDNGFSELGTGAGLSSTTPVDVRGLTSGVASVSAGQFHSCALTTAGAVRCWGGNVDRQLGVGFICGFKGCNSAAPVDVVGLRSGVTAIAAGGNHTCALTSRGGVTCWGGEDSGVFRGRGARIDSDIPVAVVGLATGVTAIAASNGHTCVLMSGGGVKCWGENQYGQVGDGTTVDRDTPVDIALDSTGA